VIACRLYLEINEQQAQNRFNAYAAGRHMHPVVDRVSGGMQVRPVIPISRVPVPPNQLATVLVEKVVLIGDRAYMPVAGLFLHESILLAKDELDRAKAARLQRQRILGQGKRLNFAWSLGCGIELRVCNAR
jgi:hypothetical protein